MARHSHKQRARRRHSPRPEPKPSASLTTLLAQAEEMIRQGQMAEVINLLTPQLPHYGQVPHVHALLSMAYSLLGQHEEAIAHAQSSLDLDPSDEQGHLNLSLAYMDAGYYTLAAHHRQRWLRAVPHSHPAYADIQQIQEEYEAGSQQLKDLYHVPNVQTVIEAGRRLDEGRRALAQGKWEDALKHSRAAARLIPGWPPPLNNASTACFYLGRAKEALALADQVLQECDPHNIHALGNAICYSLSLGDRPRAETYGQRLRTLKPQDADLALKQAEGLSLLGDDEGVYQCLKRAERAYGPLPAVAYFYWGVAAANRQRWTEAGRYLQRAQSLGLDHPLLEDTINAVRQRQPGPHIADRYPYWHYTTLVSQRAIEEMIQLMIEEEKHERRDNKAWARLLQRYPQLPAVARKMLYEDASATKPALFFLAAMRTDESLETLRQFGQGRQGDLEDRLFALGSLIEAGGAAADTSFDVWMDEEQRPLRFVQQEISDQFVPDYAQEVCDVFDEALAAHRQGDDVAAEQAYWRMLALEPRAKEAYHNLAVVYASRGDMDRSNEYLDKALAIDPLYVFPRAARAAQALAKGDIEGAKEWLEPLHTVSRWHPLDFAAYQKALAHIAIAEKDYQTARHLLETAQEISPDESIKGLLDHLRLLEGMANFPKLWREWADRYRARRQKKALAPDPTLADCFALLTKGDMIGIRQVLGISGCSALKKAELANVLMGWLSDPYCLERVISELRGEEKEALRDLLAHGGVMEWQAFADRHGHDLEESPYLEFHAQSLETVMGRLRARALLFEGTAEGQLIIAIPRELRPLLQTLLAS
ncbi:MAG: hypothetical protein QHJ81_04365 [Anaerolineae bacterium]|nr:hypothetical protein [Anaerolineae bacterium]